MFRLPLWIDLSLHALPTAILFIGEYRKARCTLVRVGLTVQLPLGYRILCQGEEIPSTGLHYRCCHLHCIV